MAPTFVDRTDVLCLVGDKIRKLRHQSSHDKAHYLFVYGAPGLGKSKLLRFLYDFYSNAHNDCIPVVEQSYHRPTPCRQAHGPLPCVLLDLSRYSVTESEQHQEYVRLLQDILDRFRNVADGDLKNKTVELLTLVGEYVDNVRRTLPEEQENQLIEITDSFQHLMRSFINAFGVVLILVDNVNSSIPIFRQFSMHVLDRLRHQPALIVVLAARRMIEKWSPRAIAQYTHLHQLAVFPVEHTRQQIGLAERTTAVGLQRLTGGNPFANALLTPVVQDVIGSESLVDRWLSENGQRLSLQLKTNVVDKYLLDDVPDAVVHDLRDAFLKISLTRIFDVNLLYDVLRSSYRPRQFTDEYADWHRSLFRQMQSSGLVSMDRDRAACTVDQSARCILAEFYRQHYPNDYVNLIEQVILRRYEDYILAGNDDAHVFVVERLYLRACLIRHERPDITARDVSLRLRARYREDVPTGTSREKLRRYLNLERSSDFGELADLDELIRTLS